MEKLSYSEAKKFALACYDIGGDVFVECWEEKEYTPMTKQELLDLFSSYTNYDGNWPMTY